MNEKARVYEHGNGFPDVGDFVVDAAGELYVVESIDDSIQTGATPGASAWIRATVLHADWDDVTSETEPTCSVEIQGGGQ